MNWIKIVMLEIFRNIAIWLCISGILLVLWLLTGQRGLRNGNVLT